MSLFLIILAAGNSKRLNSATPKPFHEINNSTLLEHTLNSFAKFPEIKKKIVVYKCMNCQILQNNPWFTESISRKIYSNIYGQHNRNWSNILNFLNKGKTPNHGSLYKIINKNLKIKSYAEYNTPFMGLLINFFKDEYQIDKKFYKGLSNNIFNYFNSRQVAGKTKYFQKKSFNNSMKYYANISKLKKKNLKKNKIIEKFLFVDNSNLNWGQNDNYNSVNSKSFASEFLDLEILDFLNLRFHHITKKIFHSFFLIYLFRML